MTMIRPTVVYGPGDARFLPKLIASVRSKPIRMVGDGKQTVDLVHVEDLARFVMQVLEQPCSFGRTYSLTNPANPSWNELLECVKRELKITTPIRHLPYAVAYRLAGLMEFFSRMRGTEPRLTRDTMRVVGRQYHYVTEAAQNEKGFTPTIDLLEGI